MLLKIITFFNGLWYSKKKKKKRISPPLFLIHYIMSLDVSCLFLTVLFCFCVSGGTVQGLISDFMGKRAPVLATSLALAMGALVGYSREYRVIERFGFVFPL